MALEIGVVHAAMGGPMRRAMALALAISLALLIGGTAPPSWAAATLKADYRLQYTWASSVAGPLDLQDVYNSNPNAFAREKVDGKSRGVLTWPVTNAVGLAGISRVDPTPGTYTIVVLFRIEQTSGYRKIIDFKTWSTDYGLYFVQGKLQFYPYSVGSGTPITANTYVQVALTRNGTGKLAGYVDGVREFSKIDDSVNNFGVVDYFDRLNFFRDDGVTSGTEASAGAVARIRYYDDAMTSSEVAALDRLPPKQSIELTPSIGPTGASVQVKGNNFGPAETVKVTFIDTPGNVSLATASVAGSFTKTVTITLTATLGDRKITGAGQTSKLKASKTFTVTT